MDLRCFIAIELPGEIKNNIDVCIEKLKETGADVKWVQSKNLHLTLKFLGRTPDELLAEINKRLLSIGKVHGRFYIELFGVGTFPGMKQPRVVWIGVNDSKEIIRLQQEIDEAMSEFGFEKEDKQFKPHLTIGRLRSLKNKDMLIKELATLKEVDFGKIEVKNISVMKSELKPGGAEHFRLAEIPLGN